MDDQERAYWESLIAETQKIRHELGELRALVKDFIDKIEVDTGDDGVTRDPEQLAEVFDPLKTKS